MSNVTNTLINTFGTDGQYTKANQNVQDFYGGNLAYFQQYIYEYGVNKLHPRANQFNSYLRPFGKCHPDYDTLLLGTTNPKGLKLCIKKDDNLIFGQNAVQLPCEKSMGYFKTNNLYELQSSYIGMNNTDRYKISDFTQNKTDVGNRNLPDFTKDQIFIGTGI
jgi:hypothetical protein